MIARIVAGILVLALVLLGVSSCGTIESGNVGVRTTLGKVNPDEVEPGVYLGVPGISRVQEFSAKEIALDLNDLTPKARDNLSLRDLDANDKGVFTVTRVVVRALTTDPAIEKGGTTTVVLPANMQTAPLINIGK